MEKIPRFFHPSMGYVYIFSNSLYPELLKIGSTHKDPEFRADELYTTGVPEPFKKEYERSTFGCSRVEEEIKFYLEVYRYNPKREFFKMTIKEAKKRVEEIIDQYEQGIYEHFLNLEDTF